MTNNLVLVAFFSGMLTWLLTFLGSAVVFLNKKPTRKFVDAALGFSAGIMLSASIWSLLLPSIEMSEKFPFPKWLPAAVGFILGTVFLNIVDNFLPHLHIFEPESKQEGFKARLKKPTLIFLAMTIHNFPEGLSVGVSIGSGEILSGMILALAIGIQNVPEGMAVSLPLNVEGFSKSKSFFYGQISAIVEPFGALLGALVVSLWDKILPFALSFAAGAMIYIVVEELIPESQKAENTNLATLSLLIGFILMMILDLSFN
ncbi:MAG: ZIP family metal transporter [Endomicrobia bacterium]|nr:ZIP family metal transporter [Endomicrobiia bacterium]